MTEILYQGRPGWQFSASASKQTCHLDSQVDKALYCYLRSTARLRTTSERPPSARQIMQVSHRESKSFGLLKTQHGGAGIDQQGSPWQRETYLLST